MRLAMALRVRDHAAVDGQEEIVGAGVPGRGVVEPGEVASGRGSCRRRLRGAVGPR